MILLWSKQLCRNSPKIWTHLVDYIAALLHPLIQGWCLGIKITNVKLYAKFFFNWKGDRIFHQEIAWWQKTNDHFRVSQRIRIRLGSYSTLIIGPVCVCLFIYFFTCTGSSPVSNQAGCFSLMMLGQRVHTAFLDRSLFAALGTWSGLCPVSFSCFRFMFGTSPSGVRSSWFPEETFFDFITSFSTPAFSLSDTLSPFEIDK